MTRAENSLAGQDISDVGWSKGDHSPFQKIAAQPVDDRLKK